jgi:hypothetical protein
MKHQVHGRITVGELIEKLQTLPKDAMAVGDMYPNGIGTPCPEIRTAYLERNGWLHWTERDAIEPCRKVEVVKL